MLCKQSQGWNCYQQLGKMEPGKTMWIICELGDLNIQPVQLNKCNFTRENKNKENIKAGEFFSLIHALNKSKGE